MLNLLFGSVLVASLLVLIFFGPEWVALQTRKEHVFRKVRPSYRSSLPRRARPGA